VGNSDSARREVPEGTRAMATIISEANIEDDRSDFRGGAGRSVLENRLLHFQTTFPGIGNEKEYGG